MKQTKIGQLKDGSLKILKKIDKSIDHQDNESHKKTHITNIMIVKESNTAESIEHKDYKRTIKKIV